MGLRSTSPNLTKAVEPREESLLQAKERDGRSPQRMGESAIRPQGWGSQQKVVAADLALGWVLQEIVQHARLATTATGAFIGCVRGHQMANPAMSGSNAGEFVAYLSRDRRMVDSCLGSGAVQRCRDSEASPDLDAATCRFLGARSVVMVPILDETTEERLGIFGVLSPQADAFSNADIVALQTLSRRIADAIMQADQCTSVSAGDAGGQVQANPGTVLPIRTHLLRAMRRPFGVTGRGLSLWILGILVGSLLAGWTLSRVINQGGMDASAKTSGPVSEAPSAGSAPVSSQSTSSSSASPSSRPPASSSPSSTSPPSPNRAGTNPGHGPAPAGQAKPVAKPQPAAKAIKEVPARSAPAVPDLQIENTLDDGSSVVIRAESVVTSKAADKADKADKAETSTVAAPAPAVAEKRPASTNAGSTSGSPILVPEKTALEHVIERVEPNYPAIPNAEPVQGIVIVDVVVGPGGQVEAVKPVDGDVRLLLTVAKAVRKWRFTPLIRNGQSVSFESHITFQFALP
jgi:TonB family protein